MQYWTLHFGIHGTAASDSILTSKMSDEELQTHVRALCDATLASERLVRVCIAQCDELSAL